MPFYMHYLQASKLVASEKKKEKKFRKLSSKFALCFVQMMGYRELLVMQALTYSISADLGERTPKD